MTLLEVKALLNITSTEYDTLYENLLPSVEDTTKELCNDTFENYMPEGVKLFIAKKLETYSKEQGASSEKLGDYSISFGAEDALVQRWLAPYMKVSFK